MPVIAINNIKESSNSFQINEKNNFSVQNKKRHSFIQTIKENKTPLGVFLGATIWSISFCANAISKKTIANLTIEDVLRQEFAKIIKEFPEDLDYYKKLAKSLNLKDGEEYKLTSIVGENQLKKIFKNSSPQDYITGESSEFKKDFTYRISLFNHSQASDGNLSIAEFLDKACLYANQRAKVYNNEKFIVALSDSDTTLGIQKALEIISKDPYKYRNLKLIAGLETTLFQSNATTNIEYNLTHLAIDPFNQRYCEFFKKIRKNRICTSKNYLEEVKKHVPQLDLSWEKACQSKPALKHGTSTKNIELTRIYMLEELKQRNFAKEDILNIENILNQIYAKFSENNIPTSTESFLNLLETLPTKGIITTPKANFLPEKLKNSQTFLEIPFTNE